jgi:hypothetical protein
MQDPKKKHATTSRVSFFFLNFVVAKIVIIPWEDLAKFDSAHHTWKYKNLRIFII